MACINGDATQVASARTLLLSMREPRSAEEAAARNGVPLFRVRASFRGFLQEGLVAEANGAYTLTDAGRTKLADRG